VTIPSVYEQLTALRLRGEAAHGLVRAEVDGSGQLIDLTLDPRAMRMQSHELAEAVKTAIAAAQSAARERLQEVTAEAARRLPSQERLAATLAEVRSTAEHRLDEYSSAVDDIVRRTGGGV
jgi:DNA-binding protein YbaB